MKRLALNGSPRGMKSNSRLILSWMIQGIQSAGEASPEIIDLFRIADLESQRRAFLAADEVLLVFPLYTDSVPGIVKNFIDSLADLEPGSCVGKRFAFVVHSGFPESIHSEPVSRYLVRFCDRLGMTLTGSAIKGGSEGLRMMPEQMTRKTRTRFAALGANLVREGHFDQQVVDRLAHPRRLGFFTRFFLIQLRPTGLVNFYWKMMLKKHNAWEKRFDRPYSPVLPPKHNQ